MNMSKEEKIVIASALICQVLVIFAIIILGNMYFPIPDCANYAQTECQFRYCGTAIPFLTVRSTAR